jgi:hypothetical protein
VSATTLSGEVMHKANADYPEGERREMHSIITEGTVPV